MGFKKIVVTGGLYGEHEELPMSYGERIQTATIEISKVIDYTDALRATML
jgi:hypothetical protein